MIKPKLICPNQEKKNKKNFSHPCRNCVFRDSSRCGYFACKHPDGALLVYADTNERVWK